MNWFGLPLLAAGAFAMIAAACDWDWFMNSRKARFAVRLFTRNGARIFYAALGLAIGIMGVLATLGRIDISE